MATRGRRPPRRGELGYIDERGDCDEANEYPSPEREVRLIERHVRLAGRDILEVGCGNGRLTLAYAPRARSVVAIEPNAAVAAQARARLRRAGVTTARVLARAAQDGIRGGPYDVVLFSYSLC